ncbi:MAG TPA: hypothetical protein VFA81_01375 [Burkholderiales bacterium]|nr:hypothetical protein [Burkholderiales bacterium]
MTVDVLIGEAAVAEDDTPRFVNHFFNPWTGTSNVGNTAPDWAVGEGPIVGLLQQWSFVNARASLYLGLTSPTQAERDRNLGQVFESLGHFVHLLQDMAQPQHVRADLHFSKLRKTQSRYELWVEQHLFDKALLGALNYPTVYSRTALKLTTPRSFFNTGGTADVATGKGISEFTTRNFVSAGTNFTGSLANPIPNASFPLPSGPYTRGSQATPYQDGYVEIPPSAIIEFLGTNITDTLFPEYSGINQRTSSFSIFDQDLIPSNRAPVFALNDYNFLSAARDFLLPRAVAYSAGLFDYFFRGDIDLRPDPAHTGKYVVINNSTEEMRGSVGLYYDARDGTRKPVPGASWSDMTIPGKDAGTGSPGLSIPFSMQQPADAGTPGKYLIVFRGDMGDEKRGDGLSNAAQGAVVGQVVTAAPLEALYVAGIDAGGRLITLRVDETGTHLLSGPDPSGVIRDTFDFDPLRSLGASGALNGRPYYVKQASFLDAGVTQYRIQAFSGPGGSFVRDPFTQDMIVGAPPGWVAHSGDSAIGAFFFSPTASGANSGSLSYIRTYVDAQGKSATTTGILTLPPLPNYDAKVTATGYDAFTFNSKLVVSESGLRVQGLRTANRTLSPPGPWDTSTPYPRVITTIQYDLSLVISLAATPSLSIVVDSVTTNVERYDHTGSGTVSTAYYGGHGGNDCLGFNLRNDIGQVQDGWSFSGADKIWVGQMEGTVHMIDVQENASSVSNSSHDWHADVSGGSDCIFSLSITNKEHQDHADNWTSTYFLRDGGVAGSQSSSYSRDDWLDPVPFVQTEDCGPLNWPSCKVSGGWTPMSRQTGPTDSNQRKTIVRAFTAANTGIVWSELPAPGVVRFRGTNITGKPFIGDASPLGEVFFATSDMSLIVHDIKNNRMPTFAPPSNMMTIVAALWL